MAGGSPTVQYMRDWMAEEMPFLAGQLPWEHADLHRLRDPADSL
jgi:hypothetical protein